MNMWLAWLFPINCFMFTVHDQSPYELCKALLKKSMYYGNYKCNNNGRPGLWYEWR